ncbi:unnamed protein product [Protopolystoma xenopodis]|uniref:Uncharacterized protein n=1 Tax=Protopolystoma xenopodis TaxID=117903 RepID=A0A448XRT7_9PLAT|nr:unnamed protein product [Protopolystoma xenopodis]
MAPRDFFSRSRILQHSPEYRLHAACLRSIISYAISDSLPSPSPANSSSCLPSVLAFFSSLLFAIISMFSFVTPSLSSFFFSLSALSSSQQNASSSFPHSSNSSSSSSSSGGAIHSSHVIAFADDALLSKAYIAWNLRVDRQLEADRLLVYHIKQGWLPLCRFLNLPPPQLAYPHVNRPPYHSRTQAASHLSHCRRGALAWRLVVLRLSGVAVAINTATSWLVRLVGRVEG